MEDYDDLFDEWWNGQLAKIPPRCRNLMFWRTSIASVVADLEGANTIRNWIQEGKIVGRKAGHTWRIHVPSLRAFLKNNWTSDC
jgi:hypothetical protein